MVIRPDGLLYVHQGIGNLGTHSIADTARPAATPPLAGNHLA